MKTLMLVLVAGLVLAPAAGSHTTKASWTPFDAEQRLTVGRFAATHGIKFATCLGMGVSLPPAKFETSRRFKHLECSVQDRKLATERQLVVHVRSETSFTAQWLTTKECGV